VAFVAFLVAMVGVVRAEQHARLLGGRDWIRLGTTEMGLDCLRRFLQGLPVDERIDFEKV
jgi:nicotinamide-nucleotide amidase